VFAASLDRLAGEGLYFLHDRRIPPTRANIDHIVIAPTGVYVIDAKNYAGRAQLLTFRTSALPALPCSRIFAGG